LAPAIAKGDPRSIEAAVCISERRAKLLGLYRIIRAHEITPLGIGSQ
jgi:hypothetical protein